MKEIKRDFYLNELIDRKENGLIKVITGIRRSGKSYLLDPIFKNYLLENNIKEDHIIKLDLDERGNNKYLNPDELDKYIRSKIKDKDIYYVLLDEIQKVEDFEAVLNGFLHIKNLDVYVTGSNSKFLSSDIITEFRGRGDEIRVYPLSFREFSSAYKDINVALTDYLTFGGMPYILSCKTNEQKSKYLKNLFDNTYINDIIERNGIQKAEIFDSIIDMLASSIGSLTNPLKIANTFVSKQYKNVSRTTIDQYLNYLQDAFLINKVKRYDIKGKKYISTTSKYYFVDLGLRNARLNFRQLDNGHLMENLIYNELLFRGYNVDIGVIEQFGKNSKDKTVRKQLEIDFIINMGSKRYYIQSALNIEDDDKKEQELRPLLNTNDFFKKIIIVRDDIIPWHNEEGVLILGLKEFLLNENSLDL